jgi:hypothetical protein
LNGEVVSKVNDALNIAPGERLATDKFCQLTTHVTCWVEEAIAVDVLYGDSDISHLISPVIKLYFRKLAVEHINGQTFVSRKAFSVSYQLCPISAVNIPAATIACGNDTGGFVKAVKLCGGHFQISSSTL